MKRHRVRARLSLVVTAVLLVVLVGLVGILGGAKNDKEAVLEETRSEIIPAEGAETDYGTQLSLTSLPQYVEWWYTLRLLAESDDR